MKKLTFVQIREKYLGSMKQHGHVEIPEASLVPENDPSLLFVGAGMVPLVPYLLGEKHPSGNRLTNDQRCLRTGDIDEVGDDFHCTTFNMLGNWSLNDYFKEEAINLTIEFYVEEMGVDINRIYASVFEGDQDAPRDDAAIEAWKKVFSKYGIDATIGKGQNQERIQLFDKKKCWWELEAGGPSGPCSEFFYDMYPDRKPCGPNCNINCDCGKFVELGNNVFMEYLKKDGKYTPLGRHNVDFGGGHERLAALVQDKTNVYELDIYEPIFKKVVGISKKDLPKSQRIITDHIKAATWMIMDGVQPGRTEQSYVLRRVIRRSVRHARLLGIEESLAQQIAPIAIDQFKVIYPKLDEMRNEIIAVIEEEENKFKKTITKGLKHFEELISNKGKITGSDAFYLYETYGFPLEITQELATEKGIKLSNEEFETAKEQHQEKSRTAAKGFFKGGLADVSDMSAKYHTATHLLNQALREVLGPQVVQKGSNINPERLRFDFPSDRKLTDEEVKKIEDIINSIINKALPVTFKEMPKKEALKLAPHSVFTEKYGETVKVYFIGDPSQPFSVEICGGPHVQNTKELGTFKIVKQENVGTGIKRIKAILK